MRLRCKRQILDVCWWVHVSNAEVLQRSGFNHWWHLTSSTLTPIWPYCTPGPWSISTWCSASDVGYLRRQKGQLEKTAGSPSQRLAQQDSGGSQRSTAIYTRCGDLRSPWVTERRNGHSDYATTMMVMMIMMKDELCQKWRVKLIFQGTYRLSRTGIVKCLKIIDVWCNLKQFDV